MEKFVNYYAMTLATTCLAGDTAITVSDGSKLPASGEFRLLIDNEILLGTEVVGNVVTVVRGQEGTIAAGHVSGVAVVPIATAGALDAIRKGDVVTQSNASLTIEADRGKTFVRSDTAFTVDRTITLPPAPELGAEVEWSDECTTAGGSLAAHDLIFDGDTIDVQSGGTDQTGGIVLATTYRATRNAWPAGSTIRIRFNGSFWKVMTS